MQPLSWTTALPAHGTAAACSAQRPARPALPQVPGFCWRAAIWPGRGAAQRPPAVLRWGRPGCRQSLPLLFSFAENSGRVGGHPRTASADGPTPADGMRRAEDSLPKAANTARQPAAHSKACPICRIRMRRTRRTQCKAFYLAVFNGKKRVFPAKSPLFLYYSFYIIQIVFFHPPVSCTGAYGFTPPHTPFRPAPPARGGGPPAYQRRKGRRTRAPARSERPYAAQCSWRQRRYR